MNEMKNLKEKKLAAVQSALLASMLIVPIVTYSKDLYSDYAADVYLLESYQTRDQEVIIDYDTPFHGQTLQAVLSPERAKPILLKNVHQLQPGTKTLNLPQTIGMIAERYQSAFQVDSRLYEDEYLDAMEIWGTLMSISLQTPTAASPQKLEKKEPMSSKDKELLIAVEKMSNTVRLMLAGILKAKADHLLQDVAKGKFSPAAMGRAVMIAQQFSSSAKIAGATGAQ